MLRFDPDTPIEVQEEHFLRYFHTRRLRADQLPMWGNFVAELSAEAGAVGLVLAEYANAEHSGVNSSVAWLVQMAGLTRDEVIAGLTGLQDRGLVTSIGFGWRILTVPGRGWRPKAVR